MADPSKQPAAGPEYASAGAPNGASGKRLSAGDLQTFNEYLLQISRAGIPVEHGLTLLSRELDSPRLRSAIDALVADLQAGTPLEQAIGRHRISFPPLYGQLIDVGIRTNNLPAVLARFGRHIATMSTLRDTLWRTCAYPAVVFIALLLLLTFLGYFLLPSYFSVVNGMSFDVWSRRGPSHFEFVTPWTGLTMLYLGKAAPFILGLIALVAIASMIIYGMLRSSGRERGLIDSVVLRLPIIGRAVRDSYVASWLDVLAIGTEAGLDLPQSLRLAGDAVAVPSLQADAMAIASQIEHGLPTSGAALLRVPAMIPMAIDLSQSVGQLPRTLTALAEQYQQQAERQIRLIPGRVMPALLITIGLMAGAIMFSLWMPLANLLKALTGS